MEISLITTSVGNWGKYVVPLIDSVLIYGSDTEIIVVDSGFNYPDEYKTAKILHVPMMSCASAQNIGLEIASGEWLIVVDCDVECKGPFSDILYNLSPMGIYGNNVIPKDGRGFPTPYRWLDGWIYAFHQDLYNTIGGFDERFIASGFEDGHSPHGECGLKRG